MNCVVIFVDVKLKKNRFPRTSFRAFKQNGPGPPVGSKGAEAASAPHMFLRFDRYRVDGSKGLAPLNKTLG